VGIFNQAYLNSLLGLGREKVRAVRERLSELLRQDNDELSTNHGVRELALIPSEEVRMLIPLRIPNYTDFYSSEEHAVNVGSMFRDPANPLLPNWKYLPVAYHGRASSIVVSGTDVRRPRGQVRVNETEPPIFCPTHKLDFELEMAFVTCVDSPLGQPIRVQDAEDAIIGMALFNDWSARDIQQWEYIPLGPFLGKNFASTMSPWIVTLDALEPFRTQGPRQNPHVLPYLATEGKKNFDIVLEAQLMPEGGAANVVSRTNFKYIYWNIAQQLAHQTVNVCNISVGDLYASGTISGPSPGSYGSMLELSWNGEKALHLSDGTSRTFILDGDTVIIRGYAANEKVRIGFGECVGKVIPAL
jgi:fumarylacetoacetase